MEPIRIEKVILHRLKMKLKSPFQTSLGNFEQKEFFIVEMVDEIGTIGFGESVAFPSPWYTEETVNTNEHIMKDFLIPLLLESPISHPDEVFERFSVIRRNNMAKSALEGAVWDIYAKRKGVPLATVLGGTKNTIDVGVSVGIQSSVDDLLTVIKGYVRDGYKRVKIKIKPGKDVEVVKEVRKEFPNLPLMVDANAAYTLEDIDHLKQLDAYNLMMIEQPLGHDDLFEHAELQAKLKTPLCLDESIHSYNDVKRAIELGSCKVINIKIGRVGGLSESVRIHNLCEEHGIAVWCGGMLEAGIGRAHNIALTTLANFTLPGDTSGSSRYWEQDIITPEVTVSSGVIEVPATPGIGYEINRDALKKFTVKKYVIDKL